MPGIRALSCCVKHRLSDGTRIKQVCAERCGNLDTTDAVTKHVRLHAEARLRHELWILGKVQTVPGICQLLPVPENLVHPGTVTAISKDIKWNLEDFSRQADTFTVPSKISILLRNALKGEEERHVHCLILICSFLKCECYLQEPLSTCFFFDFAFEPILPH